MNTNIPGNLLLLLSHAHSCNSVGRDIKVGGNINENCLASPSYKDIALIEEGQTELQWFKQTLRTMIGFFLHFAESQSLLILMLVNPL